MLISVFLPVYISVFLDIQIYEKGDLIMRFISYLLALLAGAALSFEGAIYAELGKTIGQIETSFYNFFMG